MNEVDALRKIAIAEGGDAGFRGGGVNGWLAYIAKLLTGEGEFGTDAELLEIILREKGGQPASGYHAMLQELAITYDVDPVGSDLLILQGIVGSDQMAEIPPPTVFYYLRPDSLSKYLRPDGVSFYVRS